MTVLKPTMVVIHDFFKLFDQSLTTLNFKLSNKGQISYATGTLSPGGIDSKQAIKVYNKKLVSKDYRFMNTKLDFEIQQGDTKFIITHTENDQS